MKGAVLAKWQPAQRRQRVNGRKDGRNSDGQRELTIKLTLHGPARCRKDKEPPLAPKGNRKVGPVTSSIAFFAASPGLCPARYAVHVFDHNDGVINNDTYRQDQTKQRKYSAKSQTGASKAKGADQRAGTATRGNNGCPPGFAGTAPTRATEARGLPAT